jgi:hypothetical protein
MSYTKGQRVEHVQTGSEGTVSNPNAPGGTEVTWDANEHGGYIDTHSDAEISPSR